MKHTSKNFARLLCALAVLCCAAATAAAAGSEATRDRDLARVISAKAGGVNNVAGDVTFRRAGATDWKRLTAADDLKMGDAVRTGANGRVEILLNPGSYLRLGYNSEFVFVETKLDKLRLRLLYGSAVVEATGYDDLEVLVSVETPEAEVSLLRSGLYRFNASRNGATEVFVHKGRASVRGTLVKGGQFVRVAAGPGTVLPAKFDKKQQRDALDLWSRERAQELAKINDRLQRRSVSTLMAHANLNDSFFGGRGYGYTGVWLWSTLAGCYTFLPFGYGWGSPYGFAYGMSYYGYFNPTLCTPCLHSRLRQRWDNWTTNPNLGWDTGGPITPKSSTAADWKMPSPSSDGSRSAGTSGSVGAAGGKGSKP